MPQAEKSRSNRISILCRISQESSKSEEQETGARRSGGYCFFLFFLFVLVTRDIRLFETNHIHNLLKIKTNFKKRKKRERRNDLPTNSTRCCS